MCRLRHDLPGLGDHPGGMKQGGRKKYTPEKLKFASPNWKAPESFQTCSRQKMLWN
jgi:hypothetical protein